MSRWRWGISMGRVFVSESLYQHRCRSILARNPRFDFNYHAFTTFSYPLNSDPVSGFYESKHQTAALKGKEEPLYYNIGMKELKKENIKYNQVKHGDVINICNLLFTEYRDYLIRFNDQTHVKAEQLAGKVILMYFVSLSLHPRVIMQEDRDTFYLKEVYKYLLQSHHGIEIVLVAIDDGDVTESKKRFEDIFSRMPWTAIPFSDEKCRKFLQTNFYVRDTCMCVVDSTGHVLQENADTFIRDYGALCFPFSDERIGLVAAEEDAVNERPSLMSLLGSPQRDYLITNKGEKVPICTLEEKVVGLYFYDHLSDYIAEDIRTVYKEMAKTNQKFEVVLIYLPDMSLTEESFWKTFETMPWLALPYKDPSIQKLKRIFDYDPSYDDDHVDRLPELVIFGPHGEFVEPFGSYIMYLNPVYPFTFEKLAKSEAEIVENLKMEMLWHPDTVISRIGRPEVRISQLTGKRVILFFEKENRLYRLNSCLHGFLMKLKEKYLELKGTDEEFEVIHIFGEAEYKSPMLPRHYLPWFLAVDSQLKRDHGFDFCESRECVLLAFERDGKLVRRTYCCTFADPDFPFFSGSLEEETLSQLIELQKLDYWNYYPKKGGIYTFHKKVWEQRLHDSEYRVWRMINA